jgi:predicted dehydrogenase
MYRTKNSAKNVPERKQIISTAQKHNVKLMVGYAFRFSPSFQALKSKIENGEIGEVQVA